MVGVGLCLVYCSVLLCETNVILDIQTNIMKCSRLFINIFLTNLADCLKVLTTDRSLVLPDRLGQAELLNSSLLGLTEVTLCLRFNTFRFSTYQRPWYSQSVLTYGDKSLLYAYVASDCEAKFPGCTGRYKKWVGDSWAHGRAFGYFYEEAKSEGFYPGWQPGLWNHGCITASDSQGFVDININGETHYRSNNYRGSFSRQDHNIVLMNDGGYWEGTPMHGAVTDVQVWGRVLTREEMMAWYHCETSSKGDVLDWEKVSWQTFRLNTIEMDKRTICKTDGNPVFKAFNTQMNFYETLHFCQTINGKIAVAEDRQKYEAMNKTFLEVCSSSNSSDFYTGFTDEADDGIWVDANTGGEFSLTNWAENFPSNYYSYDCSYSAPHYQVRDFVCSDRTCPICQVKPTDFILRGVCLESAVDKFYFSQQLDDFLGYQTSRLLFSAARARWEIVNETNRDQVLAFMSSAAGSGGGGYPVGKNQWYFLDTNCTGGDHYVEQNISHVRLFPPRAGPTVPMAQPSPEPGSARVVLL